MTQTKRDTLVLQIGGYAKGQLPIHVKNVFVKQSQQTKVSKKEMSNKIHIGT
jgi:hypothetical protein